MGFKTRGHAEFADRGKDIVCSALSIYSINTVNSITELVGVKDKVEVEAKKGFLSFRLMDSLDKKEMESVQLLLQSFELACKSLLKDYNKFIEIYYEEVQK